MCRQGHGPFGEFGPFGLGGLFGAARMGSLIWARSIGAVSIILGSSINRFKSVQFHSIRFAWAVRFGCVRLARVDLGRFDSRRFDSGRFDSGRFDRRQSIGRFDRLRLFWASRLAPVGRDGWVGAGRFGGWVGLIDSAVPFGRSIWSLG